MIPVWKIYPRSEGHSTVYLKNVVIDPTIEVGDYTILRSITALAHTV